MKKRLLNTMFLFILLVVLSSKVNAAVSFPNKIKPYYSDLLKKYGWGLYKKSYASSDPNVKADGKAFCTSFWNLAPSGVECTKTNWSNDNDKNIRASAAVGYIINKVRDTNSSVSWDDYYYGELAINKFLYDNGLGGSVNNVNGAPKAILNQIKGLVANATAVYSEYYNNDTAEITGMFLNGKEIKNGKVSVEQTNKYTLKVVMKCSDKKNGSQIKCDSPLSDGTINGTTNPTPTVTNSGKYTIFYYDLSARINDGAQIKINVSNGRKYYYAQRYYCGGDNQTLTPNYLDTNYSNRKSDSKSFSVTVNTTASPNQTCEEQITDNPVSNATLYQNKFTEYDHLLDINNPECKGADSEESISCEKTTISNEWVEQVYYNDVSPDLHYSALCKVTYEFENLVYDNNISKNGDLLFKTKIDESVTSNAEDYDPLYGRAIVNYDCNIPYLKDNNGLSKNKQIQISEILPEVKMTVDFGEEKGIIDGQIGKAVITSAYNECSIQNGVINCSNYNNSNGYGWSFRVDAYYGFFDDYDSNVYTVSKENGNIVNWKKGDKIYGYGILVPKNLGNKDGNYYIDYDFSSTVFKNKSATDYNVKATCEYKIINEDIRKKINYRTIDVENPFKDINGNSRYTGSNWCDDDNSGEQTDDNETTEHNTDCIWYGDVNKNYKWDIEDSELIKKYVVGKTVIDESVSDYNRDGVIDVLDAVAIEKITVGKTKYDIGDVNLDGSINQNDLILLRQYLDYINNGGNRVALNGYQQKVANLDTTSCAIDENDYETLKNLINNNQSYDMEYSELDSNENNIKHNNNSARCSVKNNKLVKKYITDRPNSNSKEPLYSFTLNAKTIKEIRNSDKSSREFLNSIYDTITDNSSLCLEQSKQNGYCNVEQILNNKGDL